LLEISFYYGAEGADNFLGRSELQFFLKFEVDPLGARPHTGA